MDKEGIEWQHARPLVQPADNAATKKCQLGNAKDSWDRVVSQWQTHDTQRTSHKYLRQTNVNLEQQVNS